MEKRFIPLIFVISTLLQLTQYSEIFAQKEQSIHSKQIIYYVLAGGAAISVIYGAYHHVPIIKDLWNNEEKSDRSDEKTKNSNERLDAGNFLKTYENIASQIKNNLIDVKDRVSELTHDPRLVDLKDRISGLAQNPELRKMVISEYKRAEDQMNWAFDHLYAFVMCVGTKIQEECKDRYEHYINTEKSE